MTPETLAAVALVLGSALYVWRELRIRQNSALEKRQKAQKKRIDTLEASISGLPTAEALDALEKKLSVGDAGKLKAIVDRANLLSADLTAVKSSLDDIQKRLLRMENSSALRRGLNQEPRP